MAKTTWRSLLLAAALPCVAIAFQVHCSGTPATGEVDLDGAAGGDGGGGQKCANSAQCKPGYECVNKVCTAVKDDGGTASCKTKIDCPSDEDCVGGQCKPSGETDGGGHKDGGGGDETVFDGGRACTTDSDCGTGKRCDKTLWICVDLLRPSIAVDPTPLDFGAVHYGECPSLDLTVTNAGGADLQVLGIDFGTGTNPDPAHPRFTKTVSTGIPATIKPTEFLTVTVKYCQDDAQADTGELQITSNDTLKSLVKVPLISGYKGDPEFIIVDASKTPPTQLWPKTGVSQYTVDHGNTDPGKDVTEDTVIMNATAGDAILSLVNPVVSKLSSGQNTFAFTFKSYLDPSKEIQAPVYLNGGDMVIVTTTYHCVETNFDDKANLTITTNDSDINDDGSADDGKAILFLKARCGYVGPKIEVSRTTVDFGDVQKGNTATEKVTIANSGKDNLVISQAKLQTAGTDFTALPDPFPSVINPSGNVELSLTYAPSDVGPAQNAFLLSSNDAFGNVDVQIDLKARGIDPTITVNPASIDFGTVMVGNKGGPNKVTITAGGYGPLAISSISFTPGSSSDFALGTLPAFPVVLNTNDKLEFDVTFQPSDFTDRTGGISIKNSDRKSGGEVVVSLAGKGANCCPAKPHATGVCNGASCVYTCDANYWDLNGDLNTPGGNGCEYGPCTKTGPEVCNGLDDDCSGTPDDGPIDQLCPPVAHATQSCDAATKACKISSCAATWYNVDGVVGNGCECQQDNYDQTGVGNMCAGAVDLGVLTDKPLSSKTATGNIVPQTDEDWYKFVAKDDANQDATDGADNWHVTVRLTTNPGNAFVVTVLQDSCTAPTSSCINDTVAEYYTDTSSGGAGENPCHGTDGASSIPGQNFCSDDTHTYYVRVTRASGMAYTCDYYVLTVSNGK